MGYWRQSKGVSEQDSAKQVLNADKWRPLYSKHVCKTGWCGKGAYLVLTGGPHDVQ